MAINFRKNYKKVLSLFGLTPTAVPAIGSITYNDVLDKVTVSINFYADTTQTVPLQTLNYDLTLSTDQKVALSAICTTNLKAQSIIADFAASSTADANTKITESIATAQSSSNITSNTTLNPLSQLVTQLTSTLSICNNSTATNAINAAITAVNTGISTATTAQSTSSTAVNTALSTATSQLAIFVANN